MWGFSVPVLQSLSIIMWLYSYLQGTLLGQFLYILYCVLFFADGAWSTWQFLLMVQYSMPSHEHCTRTLDQPGRITKMNELSLPLMLIAYNKKITFIFILFQISVGHTYFFLSHAYIHTYIRMQCLICPLTLAQWAANDHMLSPCRSLAY